jgi:RNA polymerase sigma factor (sigma-70 family)
MTASSAEFAAKAGTRDDLVLVHATEDGDVSAFEELVGLYDRKLLRIAEHITHNREDLQDAVQEAFLKGFQHMGEFREDSQFSTWLIRITVNQALMKLRRRPTTKEVSLDDDFQADGDIFPRLQLRELLSEYLNEQKEPAPVRVKPETVSPRATTSVMELAN